MQAPQRFFSTLGPVQQKRVISRGRDVSGNRDEIVSGTDPKMSPVMVLNNHATHAHNPQSCS